MRLRIALCASFLASAGLAPRPAHAESGKLAEARRQVEASERSSSDHNESYLQIGSVGFSTPLLGTRLWL
jgi:hypothetical protein